MFIPIVIGTIFVILTIIIEVIFIETATIGLGKYGNHILGKGGFSRKVIVLVGVTLWLWVALSLAIWLWALVFYGLGLFEDIEPSLYFSMVAFTTLGFGDQILPENWRLLSGVIAASGLILLGLNTAFLIDVLTRMRDGDLSTYRSD